MRSFRYLHDLSSSGEDSQLYLERLITTYFFVLLLKEEPVRTLYCSVGLALSIAFSWGLCHSLPVEASGCCGDPCSTGNCGTSCYASSTCSSRDFLRNCCHDLFFTALNDAPPVNLVAYPVVTPIPLGSTGVPVKRGDAICELSPTSFLLRETGYYFIEAILYPSQLTPSQDGEAIAFSLRFLDSNGRVVLEVPRSYAVTNLPSGVIYLHRIYRVDRAPRIVQVVGSTEPTAIPPVLNGTIAFAAGRSASIEIFKIGDLSPCDLPSCCSCDRYPYSHP